jgi:hypothetical protein
MKIPLNAIQHMHLLKNTMNIIAFEILALCILVITIQISTEDSLFGKENCLTLYYIQDYYSIFSKLILVKNQ